MIEFIKRYLTTPTYKLTQMDKLFMSLIVIGLIFILCLIVWGTLCLVVTIKGKIKAKKYKGDNNNGGKKNVYISNNKYHKWKKIYWQDLFKSK